MRLKTGVVLSLEPHFAAQLQIICSIYETVSRVPLVVTSARDGEHISGSKHYTGNAIDLRIAGLMRQDLDEILRCLRRDLPAGFDVVLEKDHIHVEYDP